MFEAEVRQIVLESALQAGVTLDSVIWVPETAPWAPVVINESTAYVAESVLSELEPATLRLAAGYAAIVRQEWHIHSRASTSREQQLLMGGILAGAALILLLPSQIRPLVTGGAVVGAILSALIWRSRKHDPMFLKALEQFGDAQVGQAYLELLSRRARSRMGIQVARQWPERYHAMVQALKRYKAVSACPEGG